MIIPTRLDAATFDRCEDTYSEYIRGYVNILQNNRYYGINYSINQLGEKKQLIIVDYARPVKCMKPFYENVLKYNKPDKWQKVQEAEILAFKNTIRELQARDYGVFTNMLDFVEIS